MENENVKQDCGCGSNNSNCCEPPKSKCWMKILFGIIILAVIIIVTIKLTQKFSTAPVQAGDTTQVVQQGACDTSKCGGGNGFEPVSFKSCDPSACGGNTEADTGKTKSCCPKAKE